MPSIFSILYSKILHTFTFLPDIYSEADTRKSRSNHPEVLYENSCSEYLENIQEIIHGRVLLQ